LAEGDRARDTVTNVALELGFTELGRFAGKYQALFGEKPSQTLRRRREEKSSSVTMATAQ
jgi:AraC family ethanolamine operon transcriptional activator